MTTHWPRAFHPDCTTQGHLMTHHPEMGVVCVRCGVRRDMPTPAWPEKADDNPFKKRTPPWLAALPSLARFAQAVTCVVGAFYTDRWEFRVLLIAAALLLQKKDRPDVSTR